MKFFWSVLNVEESVLENDKDQGGQIGIPVAIISQRSSVFDTQGCSVLVAAVTLGVTTDPLLLLSLRLITAVSVATVLLPLLIFCFSESHSWSWEQCILLAELVSGICSQAARSLGKCYFGFYNRNPLVSKYVFFWWGFSKREEASNAWQPRTGNCHGMGFGGGEISFLESRRERFFLETWIVHLFSSNRWSCALMDIGIF